MESTEIYTIDDYLNIEETNPFIIFISGDGCASCIPMENNVMDVSKLHNLKVYKIRQASAKQSLIEELAIRTVPTTLLMKQNEEVARINGFQPEEILELFIESKMI